MVSGVEISKSFKNWGWCEIKKKSTQEKSQKSQRNKIHLKEKSNYSIFYTFADQEVNRKRGRREHRNSNRYANPNQIPNTSRRGDISVIHGDCDGS